MTTTENTPAELKLKNGNYTIPQTITRIGPEKAVIGLRCRMILSGIHANGIYFQMDQSNTLTLLSEKHKQMTSTEAFILYRYIYVLKIFSHCKISPFSEKY